MSDFEFKGTLLKKYAGNQSKAIIPEGTSTIGVCAFENCDNLVEIVIPESVTEIENMPITYCDNLERITVAPTNTFFHSNGNCLIDTENMRLVAACFNSVIPDDGTVVSIGDSAFAGYSTLTQVTIPEGITHIGESAFSDCDNLKSLSFPSTVTEFGYRPFNYCKNLINITVADGNAVYRSAGNCLIEIKSRTLIAGCLGSTIPNDGTVTTIGNDAFSGCKNLKIMNIPHNVVAIGDRAFMNCASMECITINNASATISDDAFAGCETLTIRASAGSMAEQYAKDRNIPFVAI